MPEGIGRFPAAWRLRAGTLARVGAMAAGRLSRGQARPGGGHPWRACRRAGGPGLRRV